MVYVTEQRVTGDSRNVTGVWVWSSGRGEERKVVDLHYMDSPDKSRGLYVPEITSYRDLQRFSSSGQTVIGREKPVLHIREDIPYDLVPLQSYGKQWVIPYFYHSGSEPELGVYIYPIDPAMNAVSINEVRYEYVRSARQWMYVSIVSIGIRVLIEDTGCINDVSPTDTMYFPATKAGLRQALEHDKDVYEAVRPVVAIVHDTATWQFLKAHRQIGSIYLNLTERSYRSTTNLLRNAKRAIWREPNLSQFDPYRDAVEIQATGRHSIPAGLEASLAAEALSATSFQSDSIANALELFDLAKSIKSGRFFTDWVGKSVKEFSSDAWLAYRYSYSTTKSDIEELIRYASVGQPTVGRAGETTSNGRMQVKIMMRPASSQLAKTVNSLTEFGVAPNLYNLWDLVPFSFVVDWFASIGDVLDGLTKYGRTAVYDIQSVTTSWKWYDTVQKGDTQAKLTYYRRYVSSSVPPYVPYVSSRGASGETILKRCADTVALIG